VYGETQVYEGTARYKGQFAYHERNEITLEGGGVKRSVTEYTDAEGKIIGGLENDFTVSLTAPAHTMKDYRLDEVHGLRYVGDGPVLFDQEKGRQEFTKKVEWDGSRLMMSSHGLHYYILAHLEEILRSKELKMSFLIADRLADYDFELNVLAQNDDVAEMEVKIENWFLRIFSPRLKLIYDIKKKRLLSYEGLSNVKAINGNLQSVDITYKYEIKK
jgi:hypothetical protein